MLYASAAVLISGGLLMAFHDTLVRWVASRLVQQVSGIERYFDGPFDVTHVVPVTLDAREIRFAFTEGGLTRHPCAVRQAAT